MTIASRITSVGCVQLVTEGFTGGLMTKSKLTEESSHQDWYDAGYADGAAHGAGAERECVLAMIATHQGGHGFTDHEPSHDEAIELDAIVGTCQTLIDRIRARAGEEGK